MNKHFSFVHPAILKTDKPTASDKPSEAVGFLSKKAFTVNILILSNLFPRSYRFGLGLNKMESIFAQKQEGLES